MSNVKYCLGGHQRRASYEMYSTIGNNGSGQSRVAGIWHRYYSPSYALLYLALLNTGRRRSGGHGSCLLSLSHWYAFSHRGKIWVQGVLP